MQYKRTFDIIAAVSKNYGIGSKGSIPWRLSKDLLHFKNVTTKYGLDSTKANRKNVVIMGRKTWESLPQKSKPLKDRINIVLSSQTKIFEEFSKQPGFYVCNSFDNALSLIDQQISDITGNTFLIGGESLYEEGINHQRCKELFLTRVGLDFECDAFFPKDFATKFVNLETSKTQSEGKIPYDFQRWVHKNHEKNIGFHRYFEQPHEEYQYLRIIEDIINRGNKKSDRTGVGTYSLFGTSMRYDLEESFPLFTTKDVFWRGVVEELLWFIRGETNSTNLTKKKIHIWDANGSREFLDKLGFKEREVGDLGPVYGFQWRHFGAQYKTMNDDYTNQGVDQLKQIIDTIKRDPDSRRIILTAWNPAALHLMALPPCHILSQFYVADGKLSCLLYQRSCDIGLGVPFNVASYSLLCCMIAQICGLKRGEFVHFMGDTHVYNDHVAPLKDQIKRTPNPFPILEINPNVKEIDGFKLEDFKLIGYNPQGKIKMKMAV